ncbi:MAG: hypothetical protein V2A54_07815 [Bacteroidota bacterium]
MKDIYHLTFEKEHWVLRWEESSYPILDFNTLTTDEAIEQSVKYVSSVGGKLIIHNESGRNIEELNF